MTSNWMFALVAGVAVVSAACQPHDLNDAPLVKPPRPAAVERASQRLDQRSERQPARLKALTPQYASNGF